MNRFGDTICAPATGMGGGAISIIRVSGPDALRLADSIISFRTGAALSSEGYTLKYGTVQGVDEVLVSIFRAPHSYTGEDSVEISCHASAFIVQKILQLLVAAGGRMAEPGEFTRRAFINGKMDLSQAEAVADLIASGSEVSHKVALSQLKGNYSSELKGLREELLNLASLLELERLLDKATAHVEKLVESFRTGNAIRNGVPVAIVGPVNAGKSTLLNALVGEERAIVSDIPGTTRDTVEETVTLGGILFRFIDTAGLRESGDRIEKIGIERSYGSISRAQTVVAVLDGCAPLSDVQKSFAAIAGKLAGSGKALIVLRNKVDSYDAIAPEEFPTKDRSYGCFELKYPAFGTYDLDPEKLAAELASYLVSKEIPVPQGLEVLDVSARTGEGLDALREKLVATAGIADWNGETLVTNLRHYEALERALDSLRQVSIGLKRKASTDLLAQDLRDAIAELGSIFGEVTTDDLLGNIFSRFCIGK